MEKPKLPNSTAIIVLGILSILTCCCVDGVIGIILGVVAIMLAKKDTKLYNENPELYDGYSNVNLGRTLAILGIVLSAIFLLFAIYLYVFVGEEALQDMLKNLQEKVKYEQELNQ
jgi:predicted PurR-regulated permease PerM